MPASTIQILGAEKALYRALKSGARPPKHGILFQHASVHSAPKWQRGKVARSVAGKLAIAARIDTFRGSKDDNILNSLNSRLDEIREKYKEEPRMRRREGIRPRPRQGFEPRVGDARGGRRGSFRGNRDKGRGKRDGKRDHERQIIFCLSRFRRLSILCKQSQECFEENNCHKESNSWAFFLWRNSRKLQISR